MCVGLWKKNVIKHLLKMHGGVKRYTIKINNSVGNILVGERRFITIIIFLYYKPKCYLKFIKGMAIYCKAKGWTIKLYYHEETRCRYCMVEKNWGVKNM